jgi:hypothetical protein
MFYTHTSAAVTGLSEKIPVCTNYEVQVLTWKVL